MTRYDDTTFRSHDPPASASDEQSERAMLQSQEFFISIGWNLL